MPDHKLADRYRCWLAIAMTIAAAAGMAPAFAADDPLLVESRAVTEEFGNRLRSALQAAMAEAGPVGAIDVCKEIAPQIAQGKRVLIAAHGNSLRALVKYLDDISDAEIPKVEIPTGVPLVYELDSKMRPIRHYYLD